jgi:hypothetical protein
MFNTLAAKVGTSLTKSIRLEYCSQDGGGRLCHHDNGEGDLEAEIYDPERIRLMIQIIVFLEILISCIPRSKVIWLA